MRFRFQRFRRVYDTKPIAAHLYVTDRCNLDCFYCTEFDNTVPHPSLEDLKRRIDKIAALGCLRIGLQGGEPLLHPDIVAIVRHCKAQHLKTSMSTNGFKLTADLIAAFEEVGLDSLQISVDRMTPTRSTRKALKTIVPKLQLLQRSHLSYNVTGVLFQDTLSEAREVLDYGLSHDISIHLRVVHPGPDGSFTVDAGEQEAVERLVDFQMRAKQQGANIHTNANIIAYQKAVLNHQPVEWTCLAGYKYFFVSAQGKFWLCSMQRHPNIDIMDVTPELLRSYFYKKDCQEQCGVYCIVSESLLNQQPGRFWLREVKANLQAGIARRLRPQHVHSQA